MARDYAPKTFNGLASQVARDVYKKVGNKIARDMAHQYVSAIKSFYDDYTPRVYRRTYRSYYFADPDGVKAYTKFVKMDGDGKGFTVGMQISPANLRVPYTSIKSGRGTASLTGMVFVNTWVLGQHGGKLPWDILSEDTRITHPGDRWKSSKSKGWVWQPPTMADNGKLSPMQQMDAWFNGYATNDNLDKLTRDIVTASINRYIARANNRYGGIK